MADTLSSDRQRDAETVELLKKLREKLLSDHISPARVAAYRLSWLQEDGLAILKEALFGDYPRTAKKASAYGLRNMKGRMKKMAIEVLEQGLNHRDKTTQSACLKSLQLMRGEIPKQPKRSGKPRSSRRRIQGISQNRNKKRQSSPNRKGSSFNRR